MESLIHSDNNKIFIIAIKASPFVTFMHKIAAIPVHIEINIKKDGVLLSEAWNVTRLIARRIKKMDSSKNIVDLQLQISTLEVSTF